MHKALIVAIVAIAVPAMVTAQTAREAGIRAFIAGDYARAAQLLGPLAEDTRSPDGTAALLMAMLYETRGGSNTFRACGLVLKAAALPGPFMEQAAQLGRMMQEELGRATEFCQPQARWHDLPRATFVLGRDHSIEFTEDRIVVRHQGEEKRTMVGTLPDAVPLPPAYTPLDVTSPAPARRHFIQTFMWWRDTPSSWSLGWSLTEVVGTEMVYLVGEKRVITSTAADPPAVDFNTLSRVKLTDRGEAEFVIGGDNPRSAIVPSPRRQ